MRSDGDLDPSKYTREQLLGALGRMNREQYPLNFAILTKELASRPVETISSPSDGRPPAIRAAAASIWLATALQSWIVLSLLLQGAYLTAGMATHAVLLATFLYQVFALRRADLRVRASLILLLAFTAIEIVTSWTTTTWYSGPGRGIGMVLDFGRLAGVVFATIHLFRPESTLWIAEQSRNNRIEGRAHDA
jgi:hypothetical protein